METLLALVVCHFSVTWSPAEITEGVADNSAVGEGAVAGGAGGGGGAACFFLQPATGNKATAKIMGKIVRLRRVLSRRVNEVLLPACKSPWGIEDWLPRGWNERPPRRAPPQVPSEKVVVKAGGQSCALPEQPAGGQMGPDPAWKTNAKPGLR